MAVLVALFLSLVLFSGLSFFEHQLKGSISRQQQLLVTAIAGELDGKIASFHDRVINLAGMVTPEMLADRQGARQFLASHDDSRLVFDDGFFIMLPSGRLLAGALGRPDETFSDSACSDAIRTTFTKGRPVISEPCFSTRHRDNPVCMFTAPVRDGKGRVVAVLGGSVDLMRSNVFGALADTRIGRTGYFTLYNAQGKLLISPRRSKGSAADGTVTDLLAPRSSTGFIGSMETVTPRGIPMVVSCGRLQSTGWVLAANYPRSEAYASLTRAWRTVLLAFPVILVLFVAAAWYIMSVLTRPLVAFTEHVRGVSDGPGGVCRPIDIVSNDEIGALAAAFNQMLDRLDGKSRTVREQVHFLQELIDALPNPMFFKDAAGIYQGCNAAFERYIGMGREEIAGKGVYDLAPRELADVYYRADRELFERGGVQSYEATTRYADGTLRDVLFYKATYSAADGTPGGLVGTFFDITDRKRAEAELAHQKEFSETLVQNTTIPTFVLDTNHRVLIWNRACEKLTGVPASEMVGTADTWRAFYPVNRPCLADIVIDGDAAALDRYYRLSGTSELVPDGVCSEGWFSRQAGRDRYLLITAAPIRNGGGELIGAIQTLEDITDRKRTEEQLRKLSQAVEQSPATVVITDVMGNIEYVNRKFTQTTGYSPDEVLGQNPRILKGGDKPQAYYRKMWETLRSGYEWHGEFLNRKKNGELFWENALIAPMKNAAGAITHYIASKEEISERKQSQEEMKGTLSLLNAALESTADGILVRNLSGETVIFNRRFTEMWRFTDSVLASRDDKQMRVSVLDQLKDPARFIELTEKAYLKPDDETRDILEFRDGRVFERVSRPQVVENEIVGRVISYRDITEHCILEQQLRQAQKMEAIGTLSGGIAHDFNNILTAIIGYANLIQMKLETSDPLQHFLSQLIAAADRASSLTKSLLAYSRKQPIHPVPVDVNGIVKKVDRLLSRLIGEDIDLVTALAGGAMTVLADGVQIEQILMNLATNARDALLEGGRLTIETEMVSLDDEFIRRHGYGTVGRYALISVSDTGCGMDRETVERIFEPFFTTKEVGKGTGLGLSIVYGIVTQHNGFVDVTSEPGVGTTFHIYLPLIEQKPAEPPVAAAAAPQVRGSETILVVEDNRDVRTLVGRILTEYGYRVIEAVDGADGVARFRQHRDEVDLLILDVIMPKKNGRQVYDEIRQLRSGVKVIFTSGYTAEIIDSRGVQDEGLHFLQKPLVPYQLLAKIRQVIDGQV